jgi:hypothetical protein
MAQGIPIAGKAALSLSTTETANQVENTYDYIGAGKLAFYAKASAATVLCNLFINGTQVARRLPIMFTGTAGTLDTSANLVTAVSTLGGRVELTFVATTGTPTVDFLLTFEGIPLGRGIARLLGR